MPFDTGMATVASLGSIVEGNSKLVNLASKGSVSKSTSPQAKAKRPYHRIVYEMKLLSNLYPDF
jgi:hypothetical protein